MTRNDQLILSEIYGPVFQGEGPDTGRATLFLRLGGCNLGCVWCDSAFTWRFSKHQAHKDARVYDKTQELHWQTVPEVLEYLLLKSSGVKRVVITGGEPLLQQEALTELCWRLAGLNWQMEVETAGTIKPKLGRFNLRYNVSPKLSSSGNRFQDRFQKEVLQAFAQYDDTAFKFVVTTDSDLEEVAWVVKEAEIPPQQVWVMPEGIDRETILGRFTWLAPRAIRRGWNVTTRLHVLTYGNIRGI